MIGKEAQKLDQYIEYLSLGEVERRKRWARLLVEECYYVSDFHRRHS